MNAINPTSFFRQTVSAILLAVAAVALTGCDTMRTMLADAPKPSASLKGVSFKSLSLTSLALQFDIEITNPYDVPLPLLDLDYSLSGGASRLLKGTANIEGTIPAKASKTVSLPASVAFMDVINFVKGVHTGSTIPYDADVKLGVDAPALGHYSIPMNKKGEIQVPTGPGL